MVRSRLPIFAALLAGTPLVIGIPFLSGFAHGGHATVARAVPQGAAAPGSDSVGTASGGNAEVVEAANAFLARLSDAQRKTAAIELTKSAAAKWTNLPAGPGGRNGVQLRALNETQVASALALARLALGVEGFARFQEIRAADDVLGKADHGGRGRGGPGGGPGGGSGGVGGPPPEGEGGPPPEGEGGPPPGGEGGPPRGVGNGPGGQNGPGQGTPGQGGPGQGGPGRGGPGGGAYSAGNYSIAVLGTPSTTSPWLLQIGGHHLAFNIAYKGATSTATPYFVGTEPQKWVDAQGKTHAPLAPMKEAMDALVNSLSAEQKAKAKLSQRFSDVYLGPGRDGRFPERVGIPVGELSAASQTLVKRAIAAWTGDAARGAEYQKLYESELAQTSVAYSGTTTFQKQGDYVRIDGPHVWIEFVCQNGVVFPDQIHFHTIWRDRVTDYNAAYGF